MNLDNWARVAEIISSIAVVVTLALLVMELNQGRIATEINTYHKLVSDLNALDVAHASDDSYYRSIVENGGELTEVELRKQRRYLRAFFRITESAYFAYLGESINAKQWQRFRRNVCQAWGEADDKRRADYSFILTEEFIGYIQTNC